MDVTVSLTADLADFVEAEVSAGRFHSSGDVLHEALRLMSQAERQRADTLRALQGAWQAGIEGGDAGELDFAALKREARAHLAASKA